MLNELRDLARSLEKAEIAQVDIHKNFKQCPKPAVREGQSIKSMSFYLRIKTNGGVVDIEEVPLEKIALIRKWEKANGISFSAFNLPPLFKPKNEKTKEKINEFKKAMRKGKKVKNADIQETLSSCINIWSIVKKKKKEFDKINDCLNKAASEVEEQLGDAPDHYGAIKELCKRTSRMKANVLHDQLKEIILKKLVRDTDSRWLDILFNTKYQVVLELSDWDRKGYKYPANHNLVQKWMNDRFLAITEKNNKNDIVGQDAFGGNSVGKNEKFPSVRLPVLGNVILRAANKESPCQTRYGMIEAHSFPTGNKMRMEMKKSLEWLSKSERKGKTWSDLSRRIDKSALLFAYPTKSPDLAPELAGLFGSGDDASEDSDGALFSELAKKVTVALKGITEGQPETEIRIFVLAKMDKARTKIIASRNYTAKHVVQSAADWQKGNRNVPNIKIRRYGEEKGDKLLWVEPFIPFPAEMVWCLNTAWERQGTHAESVHGFAINDAFVLLLDEGENVRALAYRALGTLVRNSSPLLLAIGQQNAFGRVFSIGPKYSKQILLLPSILGLLLYKNGYRKGDYMNSPTFLVGRILSLVDQLHLKYCEHVRKNSIPPQLAGNSLMATALEEPNKALSVLAQRIIPYQAWGNTLKGDGNEIGLVKYYLAQLGIISETISKMELPSQCSDSDKAQMLLGYLSREEKDA